MDLGMLVAEHTEQIASLREELEATKGSLEVATDALRRLAATTRTLAETVENLTELLFPEDAICEAIGGAEVSEALDHITDELMR